MFDFLTLFFHFEFLLIFVNFYISLLIGRVFTCLHFFLNSFLLNFVIDSHFNHFSFVSLIFSEFYLHIFEQGVTGNLNFCNFNTFNPYSPTIQHIIQFFSHFLSQLLSFWHDFIYGWVSYSVSNYWVSHLLKSLVCIFRIFFT